MTDLALAWVILGGLLEPVWVLALKKYDMTKSLGWGAVAAVFMICSPVCLAFAMETMPVGIAYSIWTGLGAVLTLAVGIVVYKERLDRLKVLFVFLIIVGVVGLQLSSEAGI